MCVRPERMPRDVRPSRWVPSMGCGAPDPTSGTVRARATDNGHNRSRPRYGRPPRDPRNGSDREPGSPQRPDRRRSPPGGEHVEDELVSIVVPARDEERNIGDTLDALRAQDYPNLEIIVVDGGSTDGTVDVVKRHMVEDPRVQVQHNPQGITPISLNVAVEHARGQWLVRMDAHSTVDPGYVSTAVDRLREGRWGGVGGRKDGVGTTPAGRAIAAALSSRFGVGGSVYHHGVAEQEVDHIPFGAYPTSLVRALGGWDPRLVTNQDFEFDHRLRLTGAKLLFDPALRIDWLSKQTVRDLYRQYRRYGRGKVDVVRLHPR